MTVFRETTGEQRAVFLERIADEIMALGDELLVRANLETGLPAARLTGERARTVNQLKSFAQIAREGSWVDARIDTAIPDRQPVPKPDLRRMLIPIGPVIVFGASNFPFAYSVAGGDTASALATGNPVVVKAHERHPGTSELVAAAIRRAVEACNLPAGTFSMLHGFGKTTGMALVKHPLAKAVGFTGSRMAGRALFDAAASRPDPIPVFAEMSSLNPVFILPGALHERGAKIAEGLKNSVTLGVGQFCTKPGLVFGLQDAVFDQFQNALAQSLEAVAPATMLHAGISESYRKGLRPRFGNQRREAVRALKRKVRSRKNPGRIRFGLHGRKKFSHASRIGRGSFRAVFNFDFRPDHPGTGRDCAKSGGTAYGDRFMERQTIFTVRKNCCRFWNAKPAGSFSTDFRRAWRFALR